MAQLFKVHEPDKFSMVIATNIENALFFLNKEGVEFYEIEEFDERIKVFDPETNSYVKASEIEDLTNEETRWSIIADSSTI